MGHRHRVTSWVIDTWYLRGPFTKGNFVGPSTQTQGNFVVRRHRVTSWVIDTG